jgi:ketosteroid isomerase-like protein
MDAILEMPALVLSMAALFAADPGGVLGRAREAGASVPMSEHCADREYRRLDYWVGDWDVYEADDRAKAVARARVEVIAGGCALRELYEQTDGLVGQSLTTYDAARKLWHQSWVTNRGQLLTIEGRFDGDRLALEGPLRSAEGRESIVRGIWVPDGEAVRETARTSDDGGATWRPLFDVVFRRHRTGGGMPDTSEWDRTATETLKRLNREYVDAFMRADVGWYRDNLSEDFLCIESDGSVLARDEFLRAAARGPDAATYTLEDVRVRVLGQVALVHATGRFSLRDGTPGTSRYTDVYALRDGRWKAVSAQITRSTEPQR